MEEVIQEKKSLIAAAFQQMQELQQQAPLARTEKPRGVGRPRSPFQDSGIDSLLEFLADYPLSYNLEGDFIEFNNEAITDKELSTMKVAAAQALIDTKLFDDALRVTALKDARRPMADRLNQLGDEWDGVSRIAQLANIIFHDDNGTIDFNGKPYPVGALWLYRWLLGAARRIIGDKTPNFMLILVGNQGDGKSYFAEWLSRPFFEGFKEGKPKLDDKDDELALGDTLIWLIDECDSWIGSRERSDVKAFLTKLKVSKRRPYAKMNSNFKPITSFIGTTNEETFLVDSTGNRRFQAVRWRCHWRKMPVKYRDNFTPEQIWGEAVAMFRKHPEEAELTTSEVDFRNADNLERLRKPMLEIILDEHLVEDAGAFVATTDIWQLANDKLNITEEKFRRELADVMSRRGAGKSIPKKTGGAKRWGYNGWRLERVLTDTEKKVT